MPELPEVETIRRCLLPKLAGRRVKALWVRPGSRLLRGGGSRGELMRAVAGRRIEALGRRGKYLLLVLDNGSHLVIHLGMTGRFFTLRPAEASPPHTHLRLKLTGTDVVLTDARTFGRVLFIPAGMLAEHPVFRRLGVEPLEAAFTPARLAELLRGRKTSLKSLLLNQKAVAGIGNIYADEACFAARLRPDRPAGSLSGAEAAALRRVLQSVLRRAIAAKGTTIRDYRWEADESGNFHRQLKVYGREGKKCRRCGSRIERSRLAGRSTFFCPSCQH